VSFKLVPLESKGDIALIAEKDILAANLGVKPGRYLISKCTVEEAANTTSPSCVRVLKTNENHVYSLYKNGSHCLFIFDQFKVEMIDGISYKFHYRVGNIDYLVEWGKKYEESMNITYPVENDTLHFHICRRGYIFSCRRALMKYNINIDGRRCFSVAEVDDIPNSESKRVRYVEVSETKFHNKMRSLNVGNGLIKTVENWMSTVTRCRYIFEDDYRKFAKLAAASE
jgi:hypothetical protein